MSFFVLYLQEIKRILKTKDVLILVALGPIVLTLLFGGVYIKSYVEKIPIAVLDEDNSSLSRSIINDFSQNDRFVLKYNVSNREELQDVINARKAYMGIYIPYNFSNDVTKFDSSSVLLIFDGSNIVVANNALSTASSILNYQSGKVQIKVLESKDMLSPTAENTAAVYDITERILYDPKMTYMSYLILGFIAVFLQQVTMAGVGNIFIIDLNGGEVKSAIKEIVAIIFACATFTVVSTFVSLLEAVFLFHVKLQGSIAVSLVFAFIFAVSISLPALIIASFVKDRLKYSQISFLLSLPTFVASGYIWPEYQLPPLLVILEKVFWPLIYFAKPFDEYLLKGYLPLSKMIGLLIFIAIWMPIVIKIINISISKNEEISESL